MISEFSHPHSSSASRLPPSPAGRGKGPAAGGSGKGEGDEVRDALAAAAARFGFSATPRLDAELLLAHALGIDRSALLLDPARRVPPAFAALVARRAAQEPVAYITGVRGFWDIDIFVGPGVLVPRADSETLIEAAIAHVGPRSPAAILDLGTGPGTLLLAALSHWPGSGGLGVDRSDDALDYARRNAGALGMAGRARFVNGNWAAGIDARFDLIFANPPYIAAGEALPADVAEHEPAGALFAGADGLDAYRALVPDLPRLIAPGGAAVIEIGHTQAAAVTELLMAAGLAAALHRDLGGRDRCLVATS